MDISELAASSNYPAFAAVLAVLALIDSTSFGTLLIPVWLLLAPGRVHAGRVIAYLGTVAGFYLAVGVAVLLGAGTLLERYGDALDSRPAAVVQLVLGVALLALSFRFDGKAAARRAERRGAGAPRPDRLSRWRQRALGAEADGAVATRTSVLPLVGLALAATSVEVATMLPYLAAIGAITAADLGAVPSSAVLAAYCVVMVAPALLLLGGRAVAARAVDPWLRRLEAWLSKNAAEMTGWVLAIVGVLLAVNAWGRLG
ncbi:GAP family protein [Georgenia faecalis]|uniref:GAP family protein n=1 Tax=Georgenia faecalis TaxID=2483799 RepID=UPI0019CFBED5|nr:GAP family protein [Georgenia faecalis]